MTTSTQNVSAPLSSPEIEMYLGGENVASSYPRQLRVMVTSMLNLYTPSWTEHTRRVHEVQRKKERENIRVYLNKTN